MPIKEAFARNQERNNEDVTLAVHPRRISKDFCESFGNGWRVVVRIRWIASVCHFLLIHRFVMFCLIKGWFQPPLDHPSLLPRLEICWVFDVQLDLPCPREILRQHRQILTLPLPSLVPYMPPCLPLPVSPLSLLKNFISHFKSCTV